MGETVNRSICIISEQEDGHLLHLGPPSPSVCCRCFFRDMDVCLRFPANLSGSQSLGAYEEGTVSAHSHSATVAETALISRVLTTLHCQSHSSSSSNRSAESTEDNNIPSKSQGFQSECMAVINQQLQQKAFHRKLANYSQPLGGQGPRGII